MSFSVNTNAGTLVALQNLKRTSASLDSSQSRINTGLEVSSSKDNTSAYAIAQSLRGDLAGYNAVKNSLDRAQSEIDVAIAGAEAISDLLVQMKKLAVAGSDEGLDASSRESLNSKFVEIRGQIESIVENASLNGRNTLNGNDDIMAITDATGGSTISLTTSNLTLAGLNLAGTNLISTPGIAGTVDHLQLEVMNAGSDADFRHALINLENDNGGNLGGENINVADGTISNNDGESSDYDYALGVYNALGGSLTGFNSPTVDGSSQPFQVVLFPGAELYLVRDGTNSLLSVDAPSTGSVGTAETTDASDDALAKVETAIDTVNDVLSKLGTTANRLELQQAFSSQLSDSLTNGIGNLVDADMAKESATMQALQTKQQLGLQALAIANQAPQSILSLFG